MGINNKTKPKLSVKTYFRTIDFCTLIFATGVIGYLFLNEFGNYIFLLGTIFFAALLYLVYRGPSDEFAASCWNGAASYAFISMLGLSLVIPGLSGYIDGMYEAFTDGYMGAPPADAPYIPGAPLLPNLVASEELIMTMGISIFLMSFHWRRFRGGHS
jgi:hypothetical protein